MKSTAAKLSALIAVTDWGYGAGYAPSTLPFSNTSLAQYG